MCARQLSGRKAALSFAASARERSRSSGVASAVRLEPVPGMPQPAPLSVAPAF
jgi:hypothetical protein